MLSWSATAVMFGNGGTLPLAITGLESSVENGRTHLSAVSANGGAILRFEIGAGGTLVSQGSVPLPMGQIVAEGLVEVEVGGTSYFAALAPLTSAMPDLTLLDPAGTGSLVLADAGMRITSVATADFGGTSFLFVAHADGGAVDTYVRTDSGEFAIAVRTAAATGGGTYPGTLVVAWAGGTPYVITTSAADDAIRSNRIQADGTLAEIDRDGAPSGLGIDAPSATCWTTLDGDTYILQAGAGSSSLSVLRLETDGRLTPTDHIVDNLATRFQSVTALATVEDGTRRYAIAGGADGGLSVFALLPGGRLYHLGAIADTASLTLAAVSVVAAAMSGGQIQVFAAGGREAGFTHLSMAPGITGSIVGGTAAGETVSGTSGSDILRDGAGSDVLIGGAGADVFVLDYDGSADTIADFDPTMDLLDLSGWTLLRSADQLDVTPTNSGAMIGYRGEVLHVRSTQGSPLTAADFARIGVTNLDRILSGFVDGAEVEGTASGDRLTGTGAKDRLVGYDGNDTLDGAGGADTLVGGTGLDCADFSWATTPLTVNLADPTLNAGEALDVIFESVEGVFAGSGDDSVTGNAANNDLRGGGGNDSLLGGSGNDTLNGGSGGDVLDGGSGTDTVSYEGSTGSLRVDLMFAGINTNVAAGDSYVSIENLIGSQGFDNLRGTTGANRIEGMANVDYVFGRAGNDTLVGGVGDDVLFGGVGADVLDGGANRDRAQYSESLAALLVDLMNPGLNTGEAAGDSYVSIEDLAGSRFDDTLSGDLGDNRLFGREGADRLYGRAGNDYLNGGANNDRLDGGLGDDTLRGGQSADTFVFDAGADRVEDFTAVQNDRIAIDKALIGGSVLTGAEIVASYASVIGGMVVFDFGSGNTLTLETLASTAGLDAYVFAF
jgi:Ca2+-binding RTX toxin-like protein